MRAEHRECTLDLRHDPTEFLEERQPDSGEAPFEIEWACVHRTLVTLDPQLGDPLSREWARHEGDKKHRGEQSPPCHDRVSSPHILIGR